MAEFATVQVDVRREIRVPIDILGERPSNGELRERAEDWFWSHWGEALANEPGPSKEDVSVSSVLLPRSQYYDGDDRICTGCGASVEDESYLLWAFHTCRECATEAECKAHPDTEPEARTDGGQADYSALSTHDCVVIALGQLGDYQVEDGIHVEKLVAWVTDHTEVPSADVHDAIEWLHKRGRIYCPATGRYRRADRDDEVDV